MMNERAIPMSPARYAEIVSEGRWKRAPHLNLLNRRMVDLATRKIRRQAAFFGPRHGKSEFRTRFFPGWYLGNFPDHRVILACHTADLAEEFGEKVRNDMLKWGEELFGLLVNPDVSAKGNWQIEGREGSMISVGVGGPITGRGANLFLIDDPIKDAVEAMSPANQRKQWDWYVAVATYRLEPDAVTAFTATPWHARDLSGRIMAGEAGRWDILKLPALAEEDDPLGRAEGEALWPARWPKEVLEEKREVDPFWFDAMYQCRPRARDGGTFKSSWFEGKIVPHAPADAVAWVRYWDRSAQAGKGDWTVGVKMSRTPKGIYYIEHVARGRWRAHERDALMLQYANLDGKGCKVAYEQEPAAAGAAEAQALARMFDGFNIEYAVASGSKEVRVVPLASQCQAGNVYIVDGSWVGPFIAELCDFGPSCAFDDQPDAAAGAYNILSKAQIHFDAVVGGSPLIDPSDFPWHNEPAWLGSEYNL
jgi:predicted phage terminase large subunit-like protein